MKAHYLEHHQQRRMMELYGNSDDSPMPPSVFSDQIAPAWARVWNEVADEYKEGDLPWKDQRVTAQFLRLTGFHPKQFEFAPDLRQQQRALRLGREVSRALYLADEIEQLDGVPALDYAHGWMVALHYLVSLASCPHTGHDPCNKRWCPPEAHLEGAIETALELYQPGNGEHFRAGFRRCVTEKLDDNRCVLRCKP
jgi:hypothetical protein